MVLADTFQNASASDITFRAAEQALLNTFMTDYRITRTIWSEYACVLPQFHRLMFLC